jgi:hypothetical protein
VTKQAVIDAALKVERWYWDHITDGTPRGMALADFLATVKAYKRSERAKKRKERADG